MKKKFKYDGKSRPVTDLYKENFDRIFGKKEEEELKESYEQSIIIIVIVAHMKINI